MYLTLALVLSVVAVKNGFAQIYSHHPYYMGGGQYNSPKVTHSHKPFRTFPFDSFSGSGGGGYRSGRVIDSMKASNFPPHYYDNHGSQSISTSLTSSALHPSHFYSGLYFSGQDKPTRGPPHMIHSSLPQPQAYHSSPPYVSSYYTQVPSSSPSSSSISSPTYSSLDAMMPAHLHSVVVQPPSSYFPRLPSSSPSPSTRRPAPSASIDTYQEAIDLFSEVVGKLGKQTGNMLDYSAHSSKYNSPISNGVYDSSTSVGSTPPGFPRHLDHIMGPDFLYRAKQLYNKIIKEQNQRLRNSEPPPQQSNRSPKYTTFQVPDERPYYQNMFSSRPHPTLTFSSRPSYLARNMDLSPIIGSSSMETIRSIEIPIGEDSDTSSGSDEFMMTSESRQPPPVFAPPPSQNQAGTIIPPSHFQPETTQAPYIPPSDPSNNPPPMYPTYEPLPPQPFLMDPEMQPTPAPSIEIPRPRKPLNENDFEEHPLPYEEYEGLVKDIAINHNY